jgi:two-component system phosphate regulon sensor histidine kinase PhoR
MGSEIAPVKQVIRQHPSIRATSQKIRGTGLLLAASAVLFLVVLGYSIASSQSPIIVAALIVLTLLQILGILGVTRTRSVLESLEHDVERLDKRARTLLVREGEGTFDVGKIDTSDVRDLAQTMSDFAEKARRDVSEMKRLEQVRTEFLGNVSHELRTPIFSVQGYLETLLDGAMDDPAVRDEFLTKAHDNMLRLHSLLNDLIEISRIESGAMKMSFRYFDMLDLCRQTVRNLEPNAQLADVSVSLTSKGADSEGKVMVMGDRKRLEQALVNLVANAIKYNRPGGEVNIDINAVDSTVHVSVTDTGIGIPKEHLGRIFERFYRVDKGRSRSVGGSGLGLAIVKHIIEAHGSHIGVQSSSEAGTSFSFTLKRDK